MPPLRMYNHPAADLEVNKNALSISHFHDPSDDEFRHAASAGRLRPNSMIFAFH